MNATNKPIDILLSAKSAPLFEPGSQDIGLSHSNKRENIFDRVLNEQRQDDRKSDQQAHDTRRESSTRAEAPERQPSEKNNDETRDISREDKTTGKDQAKAEGNSQDSGESGNDLPEDEGGLETAAGAAAGTVEQTMVQDEQFILGLSMANQQGSQAQAVLVNQLKQVAAKGEIDTGLETGIKNLTRLLSGKTDMGEGLEKGLKLDALTDKGSALGQELKALLRNIDTQGGSLNAAKTRITGSNISAENRNTSIAGLLQTLQSTGLAGTGKAGSGTSTIQLPVSSPNWGQAVAQRIAWLAGSGVQAAQLQLNPQDLGPVEVRINIANDQAHINFSSQHGAVRDALSQSVDLLRSMLEENGMAQVDVNISDRSLAEGNMSDSDKEADAANLTADNKSEPGTEDSQDQRIISTSLIDYYA